MRDKMRVMMKVAEEEREEEQEKNKKMEKGPSSYEARCRGWTREKTVG